MIIFYRLSDGSYPKERFQYATKENCLRNFLRHFNDPDDEMILFLDNVKDETFVKFEALMADHNSRDGMVVSYKRTSAGSSAASFRLVLEAALERHDEELVYFVEDDYAHLPNSRKVLLEGLERSHYVTLYNHPDKYIPASKGGNPLIGEDGAEQTKVLVTDSSYWALTNSTTMTFATRVGFLRADQDLWTKYTEGSYPQDMVIFLELRKKGKSLAQPIPTKSTHCEPAWAAHLHGAGINDWDAYLKPYVPEPRISEPSF